MNLVVAAAAVVLPRIWTAAGMAVVLAAAERKAAEEWAVWAAAGARGVPGAKVAQAEAVVLHIAGHQHAGHTHQQAPACAVVGGRAGQDGKLWIQMCMVRLADLKTLLVVAAARLPGQHTACPPPNIALQSATKACTHRSSALMVYHQLAPHPVLCSLTDALQQGDGAAQLAHAWRQQLVVDWDEGHD